MESTQGKVTYLMAKDPRSCQWAPAKYFGPTWTNNGVFTLQFRDGWTMFFSGPDTYAMTPSELESLVKW